jgi:hypothetical protein
MLLNNVIVYAVESKIYDEKVLDDNYLIITHVKLLAAIATGCILPVNPS